MLTLQYLKNNPKGNYYLKGSSPVAGILLSFLRIEDGLVVLSYVYKGTKRTIKVKLEELYSKRLARIIGVKCFDEDCRIEIINEDLIGGDLFLFKVLVILKLEALSVRLSIGKFIWKN